MIAIEKHPEKKYRNKIVYLSFALSIMVIMFHTFNIETFNVTNPFLVLAENHITSLYQIAVPTFFALSGFLFFQNYQPKMYWQKIKSRFFSIFIPFISWNLISYLFYVVMASIPFVSAHMNTTVPPPTPLSLFTSLFSTEHSTTWFLGNLLVYIVAVPILYPVLKNRWLGAVLVVITPIIGCRLSNNYLIQALFYLFGAYAALHFRDFVQSRYSNKARVLACVFLIALSVLRQFKYPDRGKLTISPLCNFILLVQIALTWIGADFFAIETEPKWWMKISFFIYVTHCLFLEPIEKLFLIFIGSGTAGAIIDYLFAPPITFLLIVLLAWILKKYCKPAWKFLTGNRG